MSVWLLLVLEVLQIGMASVGVGVGARMAQRTFRVLQIAHAAQAPWTNGRLILARMQARTDQFVLVAQLTFLALAVISLKWQVMTQVNLWAEYEMLWAMPLLRFVGNSALTLKQLFLARDRRALEQSLMAMPDWHESATVRRT